jgi:beta-lactam-binding protein with PASTA domain
MLELDGRGARPIAFALGIGLLLTASACGSARPRAVPDVTGNRLDVAEDTLDASGLRYRAVGGGSFGIVVRAHWTVCRQSPRASVSATSVTLFVARRCPRAVPDLVGQQLDAAEARLEAAGLEVNAHSLEGETIDDQSVLVVCSQSPAAGTRAASVDLYVDYSCPKLMPSPPTGGFVPA